MEAALKWYGRIIETDSYSHFDRARAGLLAGYLLARQSNQPERARDLRHPPVSIVAVSTASEYKWASASANVLDDAPSGSRWHRMRFIKELGHCGVKRKGRCRGRHLGIASPKGVSSVSWATETQRRPSSEYIRPWTKPRPPALMTDVTS